MASLLSSTSLRTRMVTTASKPSRSTPCTCPTVTPAISTEAPLRSPDTVGKTAVRVYVLLPKSCTLASCTERYARQPSPTTTNKPTNRFKTELFHIPSQGDTLQV